jgi:hypothetical protein
VSDVGDPPWLQAPVLDVVRWIVRSHRAAFGTPLLAGVATEGHPRLTAQEVFAADRVVMAHDGDTDPRLIYANAAALRLWSRTWGEMIGLPSRLTAEPSQQRERDQALARARLQEAMAGYGGIRVDRAGHRFRLAGARLWTLRDERGTVRGQAASFSDWWRL